MIVLDINIIPSVLNKESSDNADFCYVLQWVLKYKNACFVYGGTKYKRELKKMKKCYKILNELRKAGKVVEINDRLIDINANQLKKICTDVAFNDEHIVAIINISGCKLVCTKDASSMMYLKRKDFYSNRKVPRIYSSAKNKNLLRANNLVELKNKC